MFSWMPFFGTSSNTTWQAMLGQEADAGRQAFPREQRHGLLLPRPRGLSLGWDWA